MKKGFFGLVLFLIVLSFSAFAQQSTVNDGGVSLCGFDHNCGNRQTCDLITGDCTGGDGICPEDFFPSGVECFIQDLDCCRILEIGWSSSKTELETEDIVEEGKKVYMFAQTKNCVGKDAKFEVFLIKQNLIGADTLFDTRGTSIGGDIRGATGDVGPFRVNSDGVVAVDWISYTDPSAIEEGISKFKFRVKINPEAESEILEVAEPGLSIGTSANSCNDQIDNDADGCVDEPLDCDLDGSENSPNFNQCPACNPTSIGPAASGTPCTTCKIGNRDWKCSVGDCLNGQKSVSCPPLPVGCPLVVPPKFVKCYDVSVKFPFYDKFNLILSILSLMGYYGFRIMRRKLL